MEHLRGMDVLYEGLKVSHRVSFGSWLIIAKM
jgi:hypothetical protein